MHDGGPGMGCGKQTVAVADNNATEGHVLIVDDDVHMRTMLARVLDRYFPVLIASGAGEAEKCFDTHRVDVIVCDYRLPGEDGLRLSARWRERDPSLQIIILTGSSEHASLDDAVASGTIFDYAIKPTDIHVLRALIRRAEKRCRQAADASGTGA
jgi:DNA-binding NtrC family response regulator